jgi:hypothetical protein
MNRAVLLLATAMLIEMVFSAINRALVGHLSPMHSSIALIYHAVLATEWPISWQMTH